MKPEVQRARLRPAFIAVPLYFLASLILALPMTMTIYASVWLIERLR